MSNIFPIDFEEKLTMAQNDYILFSDSEDGNKIKKAQYKNLKGEKGDPGTNGTDGQDGAAATITVGTTTTGAAGSSASVTNSGTSSAAVFNFTIPQGAKGEPGADGKDGADGTDGTSATITVGTTTTLPAGSSATVTNSGTSSAAVLNFGIPKGDTGTGDVTGPASSTDGHIAVFDGATGKIIKDGGAIPTGDVGISSDTGNLLTAGADLWFGTESDYSSISTPDTNTLYIQYKSDGGGFTPGVNTLLYAPLNGDVVDYSSYNRSFTVLGNTSAEGTPVFETLPSGIKVANFTATGGTDSNWLATTTNVTDIPSSGNMTISCWINRSGSTGTYEDFVSFRTEGGGYRADVYTWMCLVTNTNKLAFHGSSIKASSEDATIGNRCNMMFVVDGANCYIYKNLTQIYSGSYSYGNRASNLTLGGYYSNAYSSNRNEAYNGKLSDVIIENKAWSSQERSDYYDLTKANYGIS